MRCVCVCTIAQSVKTPWIPWLLSYSSTNIMTGKAVILGLLLICAAAGKYGSRIMHIHNSFQSTCVSHVYRSQMCFTCIMNDGFVHIFFFNFVFTFIGFFTDPEKSGISRKVSVYVPTRIKKGFLSS